MPVVFLGLGSNLGDRGANLAAALARLSDFVSIEAVSSVYRSDPVGYTSQPDFWNVVARGRTDLDPVGLLTRIHQTESELGRTRPFRNAPRTLDIDMLLYDDLVLREGELELPHPRMLSRAFVLRPLLELAPESIHPSTGRPISEHLRKLPPTPVAEPIGPAETLLRTGGHPARARSD